MPVYEHFRVARCALRIYPYAIIIWLHAAPWGYTYPYANPVWLHITLRGYSVEPV